MLSHHEGDDYHHPQHAIKALALPNLATPSQADPCQAYPSLKILTQLRVRPLNADHAEAAIKSVIPGAETTDPDE